MFSIRTRAVALALLTSAVAAADTPVTSTTLNATFTNGALHKLQTADGHVLMDAPAPTQATAIHRVEKSHWPAGQAVSGDTPGTDRIESFPDLDGAFVDTTCRAERDSGDIIIEQHAVSPKPGVWGVEWRVTGIPLHMNILVPGLSGVKLTRTSPGSSLTLDYPITWEAQLVIIEGVGEGFYVWAEDERGLFKRLTIRRGPDGWTLGFATMNFAPFDEHTTCDSARWRLNVYKGDWRVPAERYRDWAESHFGPTAVEEQNPAWVKDIRCCVIMGLDEAIIGQLAERLDPKQTLLYIPSWRTPGYDRDYPTYDAINEKLAPFVVRAHTLGYRVMLHVNYFGVDPLNPLYEQFEPYQVRSPWGNHDKEWWLWTRAEPEIKFAYINPACRAWREVFVERMAKLCESMDVDALHLDQTLCVYNDHNGLIDGMSMIEGNVALHHALREALPEVALSGEGLNEITYRHEAFAQRHVWGLHHHEGTWSRAHLNCAHPISSYLLRPYTIIYGYLGCAPPTAGQLYAAWGEAYQHMGVIPTLKPRRYGDAPLTGFERQFFDEATFWQHEKPRIGLDGAWPADVTFPYRTVSGVPVHRTRDGRLTFGEDTISHTVSGVTEARLPGTIPGWRLYDSERLFGLNPDAWYPYFEAPRDMTALHVQRLPEGFSIGMVAEDERMVTVRTRQTGGIVADLCAELDHATTGSVPYAGEPTQQAGSLNADDGGSFSASGPVLHAHPPWKGGTGEAYARYRIRIPERGATHFVCEVGLDPSAVTKGRSDGVTFTVTARGNGTERTVSTHNATDRHEELVIDLAPFQGNEIELELRIDPGPDRNPSFDWARWYAPRVEHDIATQAPVAIAAGAEWTYAISDCWAGPAEAQHGLVTVQAGLPGGVFLLKQEPEPVSLPAAVASLPRTVTFADNTGVVLPQAQHACAVPGDSTVDGLSRSGLFTHPPNNGRTVVDIPMLLPDAPAEFHAFVGIRDGSESDGVIFSVQVNGVERASLKVVPGEWHEMRCDLAPWRGRAAVLSFIADSDGPYICDWAHWGDAEVRRIP